MQLSIDTDVDTFDSALKTILAAYGQTLPGDDDHGHDIEDVEDDDDSDGYLPGGWSRPKIRKLVEWLGVSDAATALRFIAEHAPAVSIETVFAHMAEQTGIASFDGKAMGGRMSAVGFARNSIGRVKPVYETDYNARKYRIDRNLAAAILEAMDEYDNE